MLDLTYNRKTEQDLRLLAKVIKEYQLWNFTGQCESEVMVMSNITSSVCHIRDYELMFSFCSKGVFNSGVCCDNLRGWEYINARDWFIVGPITKGRLTRLGYKIDELPDTTAFVRGLPIIVQPTRKLIDILLSHYEREGQIKDGRMVIRNNIWTFTGTHGGTIFWCSRSDLKDVIFVKKDIHCPNDVALMKDFAEMTGNHSAQFFHQLHGFDGYDALNFHFIDNSFNMELLELWTPFQESYNCYKDFHDLDIGYDAWYAFEQWINRADIKNLEMVAEYDYKRAEEMERIGRDVCAHQKEEAEKVATEEESN